MTNVFIGFDPPVENWSKLPHTLIDALPLITSEAEAKVVLYILRHTWGYHDEDKRISNDEFSRGRKRKDGSRIDGGTGLSENAIKDGLRRAVEHGFIEIDTNTKDLARIRHYYRLKMRVSEVDTLLSGYQTLIPGVSEVDTLASEVDTRSEKETNLNILETETSSAFAQEPKPRKHDPMFDAIVTITGIDPTIKGAAASVGKTRRELLQASPPYTPEDVLAFGVWWNRDEWRRKNGPPACHQITQKIGVMRNSNGNGKVNYAITSPTRQDDADARECAELINASKGRA